MSAAPSIWLRPERGSRGPASQWTRRDVADAGVRIADASGLTAVTMRSVAIALGTAAASLYRVVDSRDQVLELMADQVIGEFAYDDALVGSGPPGLLTLARQARRIYGRHPWLLAVPSTAPTLGPHAMEYLDHALSTLTATGLTSRERLEAVGIVSGLVKVMLLGEGQARDAGRLTADWQEALADHLRRSVRPGTHPHLAAALEAEGGADDAGDGFDTVVLRVIEGLVARC